MIHKTTRSILSVLLAALLLVTSTPLTPAFAGEGAVSLQSESGEGRALEPAADGVYQISTAEDLREFAKLVNGGKTDASAVLTDDINLNPNMEISEDGTVTNGDKLDRWIPIGNSESTAYTGTFNGDGHTISGLYIDSSDTDYQGLFGYVGTFGTVKDLTVSGEVSGNRYVGGVVGYNSDISTVENCYNTGTVSGGDHVGGVVGDNSGIVTNSYNTGTVSGPDSGTGNRVGGVVGYNYGGRVKNCYNTGKVTGNSSVGGVVGYNHSGIVENCYNTGKVSGPDSVSGNSVGGVVGYNSSSGNVTGCYFLKGTAGSGIGTGGTTGATELTADEFKNQNSFTDWDFGTANTWTIHPVLGRPVLNENKEGGDGTKEHPYEIKTADELENFRDLVNRGGAGTSAVLTADINLNPNMEISEDGTVTNGNELYRWTPIGTDINQYRGTFNGDGHTISGLYIKFTADYQGLFGYVSGSGKIENLSVSGSVSGNNYVGGIVGYNNGGTVTNCAFSGSVSGNRSVGGVVGVNRGTVENCYNTGSVKGDWYVGGVVGYNISSVTNCHNIGEVSGNSYVGGVVGNNDGTVKNCYNTGTVSGPDSVNDETTVNVGGVVGWNSGNVENCYNTDSVSGLDSVSVSYVGGVVGSNSFGATVTNCYNTGEVSGPNSGTGNRVGGVVGSNSFGASVTNCYNIGDVTGNNYVGGVVGYNDGGRVENCYYQQHDLAIFGIGDTTKDDISQTAAKSLEDFHSGEVAWRLQAEQKAEGEEDPIPQVWGQRICEDKSPVLTSDQEKNVYKVTINLNDSDSTENETRYTNSDLQALTPTREGYTFDGWYKSADCSGEAVTTITDTTATLYAKWTPNTYQVTLHTNDGIIAEGQNISSYTYGIGATLPTSVTREGYTFAGWYEKEDFTDDPVAAIGKDAMGDKTYWAKWEEVENPEPTPTPTPDPTPSGPSTGDSTGWDDILDELENTAKGDQITIDMGDETKVPAEIFESLAGKDVEISFDLGDIQWSASGADIPTDTDFTDLDLGVNLDTSGIPVNVINTITGEVGTVQITLAHNGEFGFTMTLTAPLGKENAGYWANLYHYDEDAEALNFEAAAKIDEDGSVTIPFSHASQYAIVIDTHSHATVDVSDLFIDVAPNAWYKDAVQYAYDNGLMTGTSANEFAPEQTTTRAMIVSILARLENVTTAEAAGFADVDDNDWYATAVNWAANVGVVNGYEDNTFRPNTAITREQLAAILMNYAACIGQDVSARASLDNYTDQPSTWAQEAMQWAVAEGLISGVTNDQLQPQGNATRAQVAAILQRFLEA